MYFFANNFNKKQNYCKSNINKTNLPVQNNNKSFRKIPMFQSKHLEEIKIGKRRNSTEEAKILNLDVKEDFISHKKVELDSSLIDILRHVDKIISNKSTKTDHSTNNIKSFFISPRIKKDLKIQQARNIVRPNTQKKKLATYDMSKKRSAK